MASGKARNIWKTTLVAGLVLFASPFAFYAINRGLLLGDAEEALTSRFLVPDAPLANTAIYLHMVAGGVITVLAPLQLLGAVRRHWPRLHRFTGYAVFIAALMTGVAGLFYISARGTIGGAVMSTGFALYGILMVVSALMTVRHARRRDRSRQLWAERLVILALASWLYRVHYGLWEILTGGLGVRPDFTGPFDVVQVFAFFLPYLVLHDLLRRRWPVAPRL